MEPGTKCIKILDLAMGAYWYYDPRSRCALDEPAFYHAQSPFITLQNAFTRCITLADVRDEEIVFVETSDRCTAKDELGNTIPGPSLWRKSKVIGPTIYPGRRG